MKHVQQVTEVLSLGEGKSRTEIATETGLHHTQIKRELDALLKKKEIIQRGEGRKARFFLKGHTIRVYVHGGFYRFTMDEELSWDLPEDMKPVQRLAVVTSNINTARRLIHEFVTKGSMSNGWTRQLAENYSKLERLLKEL